LGKGVCIVMACEKAQPAAGAASVRGGFFAAHREALRAGILAGAPIGLGYFVVSFTLGIAARNAGLTASQGFLASILTNASAGEYVGFSIIAAKAAYWEMVLVTLITNARYLLMSCALSQRLAPGTSIFHRLVMGYFVTDELFSVAIARPGWLDPYYTYGAILSSIPFWAIGTAIGITAGNVLPARATSALSVALFGMFLASIIPPARKSRVVAGVVAVSFAASFFASKLPLLAALSDGTRTIVLTVVIAAAAAMLFPLPVVKEACSDDAA
jgi:predicted branched-subunit amino acid permease